MLELVGCGGSWEQRHWWGLPFGRHVTLRLFHSLFCALVDEDYVVCGSCEETFPLDRMTLFLQHKRFDCDEKPNAGNTENQSNFKQFDTVRGMSR